MLTDVLSEVKRFPKILNYTKNPTGYKGVIRSEGELLDFSIVYDLEGDAVINFIPRPKR
jgi:hypothetical protein